MRVTSAPTAAWWTWGHLYKILDYKTLTLIFKVNKKLYINTLFRKSWFCLGCLRYFNLHTKNKLFHQNKSTGPLMLTAACQFILLDNRLQLYHLLNDPSPFFLWEPLRFLQIWWSVTLTLVFWRSFFNPVLLLTEVFFKCPSLCVILFTSMRFSVPDTNMSSISVSTELFFHVIWPKDASVCRICLQVILSILRSYVKVSLLQKWSCSLQLLSPFLCWVLVTIFFETVSPSLMPLQLLWALQTLTGFLSESLKSLLTASARPVRYSSLWIAG